MVALLTMQSNSVWPGGFVALANACNAQFAGIHHAIFFSSAHLSADGSQGAITRKAFWQMLLNMAALPLCYFYYPPRF